MSVKHEMIIPNGLYYTKQHEWVFTQSDGIVKVGITDFAQKKMHEIVYVGLPQIGVNIKQGDLLGTVESVKAVSEVFSPVSGTVINVNQSLIKSPELVNNEPYGAGWISQIKPENLKADLTKLLTPQHYHKYLEGISGKSAS